VFVTIAFWVTGVISEHLTAILFFIVTMLFSIAPAQVVFSGFSSSAFWLIFSGLVIGIAVNGTGLGNRIAAKVSQHLMGSYAKLIGGLVLVGIVFGFLMPAAIGRVVLLVPIVLSVADHFGFKKDSNGFIGVVLAIVLGSFIPAFSILPANLPNMILAGMSESLYQYSLQYGEYFLLHFPILGLAKAIIIILLILKLYPDKPVIDNNKALQSSAIISNKEKILFSVLLVLITLWAVDFIHKISPAWIALAGAIFLLLPKIEIVTRKQFREKMNYQSLILVAGILGLGQVINYTGLGDLAAENFISSLPLNTDTPFLNYLFLSLSSAATGVVTTLLGAPAVLTPMAGDLSDATELSIQTVVMTQVVGFSTVLFPYQAPSILIGLS